MKDSNIYVLTKNLPYSIFDMNYFKKRHLDMRSSGSGNSISETKTDHVNMVGFFVPNQTIQRSYHAEAQNYNTL